MDVTPVRGTEDRATDRSMYVVGEESAKRLVSMSDAIRVVEAAFIALELGEGEAFPVVQGHASKAENRFGVKSGVIFSPALTGAKIGTYWPGNRERGLANHGSTTLLLDEQSGFPRALVASTHLTALRTAAADAVAISHLAKRDAKTLAVLGAGHQARFDVAAIREVRPIDRVLVWSRSSAAATRLARWVEDELGLPGRSVPLQQALEEADILVTVTAACNPLFPREWVQGGVHISAMGADAPGKQELPVELVAEASLFADVVEQSLSIGEFEAASRAGKVHAEHIRTIGAVASGKAPGRRDDSEITIFDSSGIALQDLAIGGYALDMAIRAGEAFLIDLS